MSRPGAQPLTPTSQQDKAITSGRKQFRQTDRGTLVAACGSGKTLISIKIAESFDPPCQDVLVAVPTQHLIGQTVEDWSRNFDPERDLEFVIVSSDETIPQGLSVPGAHQIPVTTDPDELRKRLLNKPPSTTTRVFVSTYRSCKEIVEAQKGVRRETRFHFLIADEAHNTAGTNTSKGHKAVVEEPKNGGIDAARRLFQTATPRMAAPAESDQHEVGTAYDYGLTGEDYSMDDEEVYGRIFYEFTLRQAIEDPELPVCDYRIVPHFMRKSDLQWLCRGNHSLPYRDLYRAYTERPGFGSKEAREAVERYGLGPEDIERMEGTGQGGDILKGDVERYVEGGATPGVTNVPEEDALERTAAAYILQDLLDREFDAPGNGAKVISYHNKNTRSKRLQEGLQALNRTRGQATPAPFRSPMPPSLSAAEVEAIRPARRRFRTVYMDGTMDMKVRAKMLGSFAEIPDDEHAVLCNCQALNEGVNIDGANTIIFSDPRGSPVEVMQAIGRVIRSGGDPGKVATVIVPVVVDDLTDPMRPRVTPYSEKRLRRALLAGKMIDAHVESRIEIPDQGAPMPQGRLFRREDLPANLTRNLDKNATINQDIARKVYDHHAENVRPAVEELTKEICKDLRSARGRPYWGVQWNPKKGAWRARPRNPWWEAPDRNPDLKHLGQDSVIELGHFPTAEEAAEAIDEFIRNAGLPYITNFGDNPHRPDEMDVDSVTSRFPGQVSKAGQSRTPSDRWRAYIDICVPRPDNRALRGVKPRLSGSEEFSVDKKPNNYHPTEGKAARAQDAFAVRFGFPERRILPHEPLRWDLILQDNKTVEAGIEEETYLTHDPDKNFWVYVRESEKVVHPVGYAATLEEARRMRDEACEQLEAGSFEPFTGPEYRTYKERVGQILGEHEEADHTAGRSDPAPTEDGPALTPPTR